MSPWGALHALRIGCVQYLNSKPLIHGYDGPVVLAHPSELARSLAAGELDAALVPAFEFLREPHYALVDGVAIASDGPVHSVILAHRGELRDVRRVALDPASLTSANLLRVLLAEFHGIAPQFGAEGDARLLIGNQAIAFREFVGSDVRILDLGEEWRRCTALPFVFAAWALRPALQNVPAIASTFRTLKAHGIASIDEIVAGDATGTPDFRRSYLTQHIRFGLGPREKAGIARYRELLHKHALIADAARPLVFV
ncbi:MAG: menaquinone biosynthesis protein [Chthoniobacteraceae bacterium]